MKQKEIVALAFIGLMAALFFPACSDMGSNPVSAATPPQAGEVSFSSNVKPVLERYGCISCHGGSGGLVVSSVSQLLQGGDHGPAIVPTNADASNLIKKLSASPPFGVRMPQGGPYLPDSTIQMIRSWINAGAKNN